ncbi:DegV family protein [Clostridium sp. SHJSY1]|uniref:DegV family protein n=1 Tax=Clostridium sp. SHJSY1 TaxID=2942483 RepID=UPI002874A861|nr:DegV family protein [Clostridium sp. SHJSY1]MDS0525328.1 DegV family protein [Clostridium sp. SHJSY1]
MQKIAIITDSGSDLSPSLLKEHNIYSLPFRIIYSDNEYEDGVTITPHELYNNLEKEIPTTSLPSREKIENILTTLEEEGYTHVIAIHISSALSGTINSVRLALEDHPKLTSYVYDTKTLCMAEGSIALSVSSLIKEGKTFEEIISMLPCIREKVHTYFTLATLEYLKRGGRIGKVAGTIGELLNLKPIVFVGDDGVYQTFAKARGRKQSINKLKEIIESYLDKNKCNIWIIEGNAIEESQGLLNSLKDHTNVNKISIATVGPALGVHTGPGLLGFIIEEL